MDPNMVSLGSDARISGTLSLEILSRALTWAKLIRKMSGRVQTPQGFVVSGHREFCFPKRFINEDLVEHDIGDPLKGAFIHLVCNTD